MEDHKNEDVMNKYLTGNDFNIEPTSISHGQQDQESNHTVTQDQDVSLLVSPSFSDYVSGNSSTSIGKKPASSSKRKSRYFSNVRDEEGTRKVRAGENQWEKASPDGTKSLLDTSLCPSLGLGSPLHQNEAPTAIDNSNENDDRGEYVFQTKLHSENSENHLNLNEKFAQHVMSQNTLNVEKKKVFDSSSSSQHNEHFRGKEIENSNMKLEKFSLQASPKSPVMVDDSKTNALQLENRLGENSKERRDSWNNEVSQKLEGISNLMDSFADNEFVQADRKTCASKEVKNSSINDATPKNDDELPEEPFTELHEPSVKADESEFERKYSLDALRKKYPSPDQEHKDTSITLDSQDVQKKLERTSNPLNFIRNLLSPPKFFSPSQKRNPDINRSLDQIKFISDKCDDQDESRDGLFSNERNAKEKNDSMGVSHWKLSLSIPNKTDLSLDVSPISFATSKSEEFDDSNDPNLSGEILGEKILENDQTSHVTSKINSSLYLSPVDTNSENSNGIEMGSGSVEVSKIMRQNVSSTLPASRIHDFSGRSLSAEKMHSSSFDKRLSVSPLHTKSNETSNIRKGDQTPSPIEFSSIRDLRSARKKVDASSVAFMERLQGASQRRKLLVSRSGENLQQEHKADSITDSLEKIKNIGALEGNLLSTSGKTKKREIESSKIIMSAFKPFKARPLPSTTSMLGQGGQLGVPKVPKRSTTNPVSPKLGPKRRHLSPSRAILKIRAEEKKRKQTLLSAIGAMPVYKVPSMFQKKKLPPEEDPYIPFKARPIQSVSKAPKDKNKVGASMKLERFKMERNRRVLIPSEDPYVAFKALSLPSRLKVKKDKKFDNEHSVLFSRKKIKSSDDSLRRQSQEKNKKKGGKVDGKRKLNIRDLSVPSKTSNSSSYGVEDVDKEFNGKSCLNIYEKDIENVNPNNSSNTVSKGQGKNTEKRLRRSIFEKTVLKENL